MFWCSRRKSYRTAGEPVFGVNNPAVFLRKILGLFPMAKRQNSSIQHKVYSDYAHFFVLFRNLIPVYQGCEEEYTSPIYGVYVRVPKSVCFLNFFINLFLYKIFRILTGKNAEQETASGCIEKFWRLAIENKHAFFRRKNACLLTSKTGSPAA